MNKRKGLIILSAIVLVIIVVVGVLLTGGSESKDVQKKLCDNGWNTKVTVSGKASFLFIYFQKDGKYIASLYVGSERLEDEYGKYTIRDGVVICTPNGKGYQDSLRFTYEYDKKTDAFSLKLNGNTVSPV